MCNIIAVTNEKGGCAKTTTAVNLAAILGQKGHRTLLVDLDYQSYASHYLDLYDEDKPGILNVLQGLPAADAIRQTAFEHLDLLPATISFKAGEELLLQRKLQGEDYRAAIREALSPIVQHYRYIILDCPPNGVHLKEAIEAFADSLILPTIPDDYAIHSLLCKATELVQVRQTVNPRLAILGVLIVMQERTRNKEAYRQALQAQEIFPCFRTVIRKNTLLSEAINARQPICYYRPRSNGALDYGSLADEVLALTAREEASVWPA